MNVKLTESRPLAPAGVDEAAEARVAAVIPGQTTIVLKSGVILAGQLIPAAVHRRKDVMDKDGSPIYDIDWTVVTAKIPQNGLPNLEATLAGPPGQKLSS